MTTSPSGPRVLACGLATLDVVQTVEHVPAADEKLVAAGLLVGAGGPAANAAVTAVALGVPTRLMTRIGASALGRVVTADLVARGVEVIDRAGPDDAPAVSTVLVTRATGERAVVSVNATHGARAVAIAPTGPGEPDPATAADAVGGGDVAAAADALDGATAVLLDGHHLDLAIAVARAARTRGIPVLLDGGSWKPGLEALLGLVDVALLSGDFRVPDDVPGPDDVQRPDPLERLRAWGPAVVGQSHGADAVVVLHDGIRTVLPVPRGDVVDTLGAGDVLHGALVAWLARDPLAARDPLDALRWATEVASASVGAAGAHGWQADGPTLARLRTSLTPG